MAMLFDAALAFALTLPGVEEGLHYGLPAARVRGKGFLFRTREPGSFGISATHEEVAHLKESDPAQFWQSPHWEGWPGILVREDAADRDWVEAIVERAWDRRASRAQRAARAAGPPPRIEAESAAGPA
jgi:hypothetical protein